jgi:hypothetical protein
MVAAGSSQSSRRASIDSPTTIPETIVYGSLSDHGPDYDAQGNPVDRHGTSWRCPQVGPGSAKFLSANRANCRPP